jgi:hypothetical protein
VLYDQAALRFRSLVTQAVPGVTVVWERFSGQMTYPWVSLQVVTGPTSIPQRRKVMTAAQITVTVDAGSPGDVVGCSIGGRYLQVAHTGSASTTATALAALAPSEWSAAVTANEVVFDGPGIYGGAAYLGCTLVSAEIGEPHLVQLWERSIVIQCDVWTQLNRDTGSPARWTTTGCDAMALKIQEAVFASMPTDPWRIYCESASDIRPFNESFSDGRDYRRASFDTRIRWVDYVGTPSYGDATGVITRSEGEVTTDDGTEATTTDEFAAEWPVP